MGRYIIGLDEGTTSARSVVFDVKTKKIIATEKATFSQIYPKVGWVEQDAEEIAKAQFSTLKKVLKNLPLKEVIGIGITNQRETIVAWDKNTGKPIYNAIVWQCRRTSDDIEKLSNNTKKLIKDKTGLIPDAYFSASKIKWIIDNVKDAKKLINARRLCVGNINTYLAYLLTGEFVTDTTNASRTMLFNIHSLDWDSELLKIFGVPREILPNIIACDKIIGPCKDFANIPLCGMIGDQQSSLFGQSCISIGMAKSTYGTGGFTLINTGKKIHLSDKLLSTVAYTIGDKTTYAIEGSIYSACSTLEWLQNSLGLIDHPATANRLALTLKDNDGVYFVPAFTGLGAPYWNDNTRGTIVGLSFNSTKAHICRSVLESIAYNTRAIVDEMTKEVKIKELRVDGGGSNNTFLLQFQADMINKNIVKGESSEATAMGAIYMAGLATKTFTIEDIKNMYKEEVCYTPKMKRTQADKYYDGWNKAVNKSEYN